MQSANAIAIDYLYRYPFASEVAAQGSPELRLATCRSGNGLRLSQRESKQCKQVVWSDCECSGISHRWQSRCVSTVPMILTAIPEHGSRKTAIADHVPIRALGLRFNRFLKTVSELCENVHNDLQ